MGGDIDFQTRNQLDLTFGPDYYETALKLRDPGKISGIIRSRFGYYIVKLTAIKAWEDIDPLEAKKFAFEEERAKVFEKYMNELRTMAKVTVHSELLKEN